MTDDFKKVKQIILDFKLNQSELARVCGISQGNFSDKLRGVEIVRPGQKKQFHRFTPDQKKTIKKHFAKLKRRLCSV